MALRMIEVYLKGGDPNRVRAALREQKLLGVWPEKLEENGTRTRVLLEAENSEAALDILEKRFSAEEGFRIVLMPVEATLPRPEEPEEGDRWETAKAGSEGKKSGISREELYANIEGTTRVSAVFVVLVVLSSVVATVGLMENSVAIIIGAMVIAPLIGPNMALALATTLGDMVLARRAAKAAVVGTSGAFALALLLGTFLPVDPSLPEIASRTRVGVGDIVLALAAGTAASLSYLTGLANALIGVMVAVAFLPPLVVSGMLLGAGYTTEAFGALLLLLVNLFSINLAGVVTFLASGVRPKTWWEEERAKKATRQAIIAWVLLLGLLTAVIVLSQRRLFP
ncbi:MAG TPA: TIGR00341 family protein [Nitrospirota bacterium]|nr:TIGR00341 family protein [Nitrospirota bacterium]